MPQKIEWLLIMMIHLTVRAHSLTLMVLLPILAACTYIKPTSKPIEHDYFQYDINNKVLVVLLPGIGESPKSFIDHGVVKQIQACRPALNIVGVNAYYSYYRKDIIARRVHYDVILPAREGGVEEVWFMGVSLGGLGTLFHRQSYPQDMDAGILMAPYLGDADEFSMFLNGKMENGNKDKFVDLWQTLKENAEGPPELTMAYGKSDTYSKQQAWLASMMPNDRVVIRKGGHLWTVWEKLWPEVLLRSGFCSKLD